MIKNHSIICVLLLVTLAYQNTFIHNLPSNFVPKDEAEYTNYLQIMLGNYEESSILSDNIQALINAERPSILNAPSKIVLLLTTLTQNTQLLKGEELKIAGNDLKSLTQKYRDVFEIVGSSNLDQATLEQTIANYQAQGMLVNLISGAQSQIRELESMLGQTKVASPKRRLQAPQTQTDNTYLIKFFFSILFILVIVSCVGFISQNDGKKDTLLYAKFIADVGAR